MNPIQRLIRNYVQLSLKSPWLVLLVIAVITAVLAWRGSQIEINTDLKSLLPEDAPSVLAIEEAKGRRSGSDLFVIAVESPEPLATVQFMDALAEGMAEWDDVEWIEIEQDRDFFRDHALLYMPVHELEQMLENLKRMRRQRTGEANPLFIDLEESGDEDEEEFDFRNPDNWVSEVTLMEMGVARDDIANVFPFLENADVEGESGAEAEDSSEEVDRSARQALPDQYDDYKVSPDGTVGAVTAQLTGRSTDIEYSEDVYNRAQDLIAELNPRSYHPEMRALVRGAYMDFEEVDAVKKDMTTATSISIGLVLVLLIGFFRNVRSVFVVLVPLLVGVAWTLGLIEIIYGELNTLTAFVFSMLIGMGIDFGIHIYRRSQEEFFAGKSWEDALFESITKTGRALLTATVTTVVSLLTLTLARFEGFNEFGVACGLGVAICLLTACMVAPPLVGAAEKLMPARRKEGAIAEITAGGHTGMLAIRIGAMIVLAFSVWSVANVNQVAFEYEFDNLRAQKSEDGIAFGSALGRNRSSTPAIILGDSEEQMRQAHMELRERYINGDPLLRGYQTIESIVPGDQEARMDVIDEIYEELDRRAWRNAEGDEGEMVSALLDLTDVEPFTVDQVPEWARRGLIEKDGSIGAMGLLYGEYDKSNALDVMRFQEGFGAVTADGEEIPLSSNGFIIADVVSYVQADGRNLAIYVTLGLFLVLLLDLRDPVGIFACLGALGVAVLMTAGVMVIFDIKVGLYNMVVLPTVLGVGIDGAVHIYHRYLEVGRSKLWGVMKTTGMAVAASSITTAAGFFGLLLVEHMGVQTIGALAVTGILASFIAVSTVLPALLYLIGKDEPMGHGPSASEDTGPASGAADAGGA